jgi:hypothetical protein
MRTTDRQLVIDVTTKVTVKQDGSVTTTVEHVDDALGADRTQMFRDFAAQENLDLTSQDQIEAVAGQFVEKFGPTLP